MISVIRSESFVCNKFPSKYITITLKSLELSNKLKTTTQQYRNQQVQQNVVFIFIIANIMVYFCTCATYLCQTNSGIVLLVMSVTMTMIESRQTITKYTIRELMSACLYGWDCRKVFSNENFIVCFTCYDIFGRQLCRNVWMIIFFEHFFSDHESTNK